MEDSVNRRLLIFPKGNSCEFLSVYLDVADPEAQPYGQGPARLFHTTTTIFKIASTLLFFILHRRIESR